MVAKFLLRPAIPSWRCRLTCRPVQSGVGETGPRHFLKIWLDEASPPQTWLPPRSKNSSKSRSTTQPWPSAPASPGHLSITSALTQLVAKNDIQLLSY
jgi:hypothetical protein